MELWPFLVTALVAAGALAVLWRRALRKSQIAQQQGRAELQALRAQLDALTERLSRIEAALAASGGMLLAVDRELRLSYANQTAQQKLGQPHDSPTLLSYSGSLELEQLAQDALETESVDGLERIILIQDRPYQAKAVLQGDNVGLALSDVSELQRLSRARQDFIANLSHELSTPLTSLRLLVDTLLSKAGKDPQLAEELAGKIVVEVDAMHQMAREMLDLVAIESGQQIVRLVDVSLHSLVEEVVGRMADQAARSGISIQSRIEPELTVLADPEQAGRAILNVLHNAVKFSPAGGKVELWSTARPDEDLVVLSIGDNGPGIPPQELERIFERFYRVRNGAKSPGTGLGLSIAHHVMRAHAGRIWAENRLPPDKGAIFHLAFLPA